MGGVEGSDEKSTEISYAKVVLVDSEKLLGIRIFDFLRNLPNIGCEKFSYRC